MPICDFQDLSRGSPGLPPLSPISTLLSRTSDYCTGHIPSIVQLCYARSHADVVNTIVVLLCRLQDRTIGSLVARTLAWLQRPIASLTQNLRPVTMQVPDTGSEP